MAGKIPNPIPRWLNGYLNDSDLDAIEQAVAKAEKGTALEVVPMVVRRSIALGHVPVILTLTIYTLVLISLLEAQEHVTAWQTGITVFGTLIVAPFIAWALSHWDFLQRVLTANNDERLQSQRRALVEFAGQKMTSTKQRSGFMIFVSMVERQVVLMPDIGCAPIFPDELCQKWVSEFAVSLKNKQWREGFTALIAKIADQARSQMPPDASDENELTNRLQIKD